MPDPFASLAEQRTALADGRCSARELTDFFLERIARLDPRLNAVITVAEEQAHAAAAEADARLARGDAGPLTGVPYLCKDIFCTDGIRTTCGSRMLQDFVAPYEATATKRLAEAGAVLLGKTNMDEFAMGSSNENSHFGPVRNPWDSACVPGGSSGGSAAAVAAGLSPWATGTDTGGSIRQPAAFCGLTGIKPTYGRVSRYGMVAFASSLDQGGVLAHSVADALAPLRAMAGFDPLDSTSSESTVTWADSLTTAPLERPFTVGLPRQYFEGFSGSEAPYDAVRNSLETLGCRFVDVDLPSTPAAIAAYYVISGAEASTNLSRYDGVRFGHRAANADALEDLYRHSRSEGFGAEVKRRILTGTYALSVGYFDAYYLQAQKIRRLIQNEFLHAFKHVDVLLSPTAPGPAFELGALVDDAVAMYQQDAFTIPASLAGLPGLSMPCGLESGRPLGVQLIAPPEREDTLFSLGAAFQRETDWHRQHPEGWA